MKTVLDPLLEIMSSLFAGYRKGGVRAWPARSCATGSEPSCPPRRSARRSPRRPPSTTATTRVSARADTHTNALPYTVSHLSTQLFYIFRSTYILACFKKIILFFKSYPLKIFGEVFFISNRNIRYEKTLTIDHRYSSILRGRYFYYSFQFN